MNKKYFIVTFGCQANEADSELIAAYYEKNGWKEVKSAEEADELVFNSCSVRESAENRVIGQIYQIDKRKKKQKKNTPKIILTGCMTGHDKKYLQRKIPGLNKIWPIGKYSAGLSPKRKQKKQALVQIMTGCDNYCTYCVVPYSRGREKSRPIEAIYCEVKKLVKEGCDTVMLLGQNVNSYHKNTEFKIKNLELRGKASQLKKKYKNNFAVLLAILNDIEGLKKIKFLSSNPQDLTDGVIEAMALPKVDRYLHLAMQSGDDKILKAMNRKHSSLEFYNLVKKIRRKIPGIKIGTDIIVGFPGESQKQFNNTLRWCRKIGFCKAYVARYSPREQTAAYKLKDDVPAAEKKRRWKILDKLINKK